MSANFFIYRSLKSFIDKKGFSKIELCVSYNGKRFYIQTPIKTKPEHFRDNLIIGGENKLQKNALLNQKQSDFEGIILEYARNGGSDINELKNMLIDKKKVIKKQIVHNYIEYLETFLKGKLSEGRLKHYAVIRRFFTAHYPNITFSDISVKFLYEIEHLFRTQQLDNNTINAKMAAIKAILNKAKADNLIELKQFDDYKKPKYINKIPDYLTIEEIEKLESIVFTIEKKNLKLSGYYFLLSCYTGYRISDAKAFSYENYIKDGMIIIRAQKNKNIVSIPIHTKLSVIIEYLQKNSKEVTEKDLRLHVKQICFLAKIDRDIKFHTARHSFAMMLMKKGFSMDEVAHLLGDTIEVAKVYARIHNESLNKKILERF